MEKGDGSVVIVVDADSKNAEKKLKDVAKKAQNLQDTLKNGKNIVFHMDVSEADKEMRRLQKSVESLQAKIQEKTALLSGVKSEYGQLEVQYNEARLAKNYNLAFRISKELDNLDKKAQGYEKSIEEANVKIGVQKQMLSSVAKAIVLQQQQSEAAAAAALEQRNAAIDAAVEKALSQQKTEAETTKATQKTAESVQKTAQYSKETTESFRNLKQVSEQIRREQEKAKSSQIVATEQSKRIAAAAQETARFQRETEQSAQRFINELSETNVPLSKMQKSYEALQRKILATTQRIAEMRSQQEAAQNAVTVSQAELDKEKAVLDQMPRGRRKSTERSEQEERVRALQSEFNRLAGQVENYDRRIMDAERTLRRQVSDAEELSERIRQANSPAGKLASAFANATKQVGKLAKRISGLAQRVFVFSLITSALRSVREYIGGVIKSNSEAAASIARLKGAFLTLAQPIMETVLPVFIKLLNVLTRIVQIVANLVSRLLGKNVSNMAQNAKNLNKQLNGTSKAADKAASSLAAFDEINQLSEQNSSSGDSSGSDSIAPDFSGFEPEMQSELDALTAIVAGAALAVGAILALSGVNIPLGIGLMAIGAAVLYEEAKLYWDKLPEQIQNKITGFLVLAGVVALAIGLILALTGVNIPLGIGLIALGVAGLAAAAALNWDKLLGIIQEKLSGFLVLTGIAALTIGLILALSGTNIPLGIGLIAIGVASLASAATLNWDELGNTVSEKLATIGTAVGALIAVIGVVLLLIGKIPLGIACIIAGIAIFSVSAANLNWDAVGDKVKTVLSALLVSIGVFIAVVGVILMLTGNILVGLSLLISGIAIFSVGASALKWDALPNEVKVRLNQILTIVAGGLVALGIILLLSGAGIPFGLGCILAGIGILSVRQVLPNWGFFRDKVDEIWEGVKAYFNANIAPIFTTEYWQNKASAIINGLSAGISNGVGKIKDALSNTLNSAWNKVSSTASGIWDSLTGSKKTRSAVSPQLTTARVEPANIPALAKGAVIPANREFLAVLGDQTSGRNLEAPESLIRQIVREESGGANTQLLQAILDAIREGQVIMVDKQQLGRTVQSSLTSMQRAGLIKV